MLSQILVNCSVVLFKKAFLLYINDVVSLLADESCTCKLYADDLKLYTILRLHDNATILQNKLDDLCAWSTLWQLKISLRNVLSYLSLALTVVPACVLAPPHYLVWVKFN